MVQIPYGYVYPGVTALLLRISRTRRAVSIASRKVGPFSAIELFDARCDHAAALDVLRTYNMTFEGMLNHARHITR